MRAQDSLEQDLIQLTQAETRSQIEMVAKRIANSINNMITENIECTTQVRKGGDQLDVMRS
jgi:hypothetical protein